MDMTRRIGNTTYKVKIYFDENGTMTMEDRILRLIANDTNRMNRRTAHEALV